MVRIEVIIPRVSKLGSPPRGPGVIKHGRDISGMYPYVYGIWSKPGQITRSSTGPAFPDLKNPLKNPQKNCWSNPLFLHGSDSIFHGETMWNPQWLVKCPSIGHGRAGNPTKRCLLRCFYQPRPKGAWGGTEKTWLENLRTNWSLTGGL